MSWRSATRGVPGIAMTALASLVYPGKGAAAQATASPPTVLAWSSVDIVLLADSPKGVQVLVLSSLGDPKPSGADMPCMTLDPVETGRWLQRAGPSIDSASQYPAARTTARVSEALRAEKGRSAWIDFDPERDPETALLLLIHDSVPDLQWGIPASWRELEALIKGLDSASRRSRDATGDAPRGEVALCDELDRAPSLKFAPQPKFPEKAIRDGREGQVGLLFVVDAAGAVVPNSIQVVFSDGDEFAKAAIEVIRRARFLPGARGGKAVRALAGQRVSFKMDSEAATPRGTAPAPLPPSTRPVTPDRP